MERLIILILALLFVLVPTVLPVIRRALRGLGRNAGEAPNGLPAGAPAPNGKPDVEQLRLRDLMYAEGREAESAREDVRPPLDVLGASGSADAARKAVVVPPQRVGEAALRRIEALPRFSRAIVWSEILGRPRADREPDSFV